MSGEPFSGRTPTALFPYKSTTCRLTRPLLSTTTWDFPQAIFQNFLDRPCRPLPIPNPVNIIKYVTIDEGWRFAPLARKPNGNIRWGTVLIEGAEMRHPEGRFFIECRNYCSFAYSALACFRMGMWGSASFQSERKSWYADCALVISPASA